MKKKFCVWLCFLLALLMLAGCGSKNTAENGYYSESYAEATAAMDSESISSPGSAPNAEPAANDARKWIVTMNLSCETNDLDQLLAAVQQRITDLGGYAEDQNIYNGSSYSSYRSRRANLTVRVPVEKAEQFVEHVNGLSNVTSSSKNMEDVTLQFVATESRMNALQAEETRLLELMSKAENMSDLLVVESRLTDVRYELENITSQLRVLSNLVDYATIYLNISEVREYTPVEEPSFFQRISTGFKSNLEGLGETIEDFIVWFISSLPTLVVLFVLGFGFWKLTAKSRAKRRERKAAKKAEKLAKQQKDFPEE